MRPASNLKANPDFKVSRNELKQGFLGFYNGRFGTSPYEFVFKLAAAALYPWANQDGTPELKNLKALAEKNVRDATHKWSVRSTLRFDAPTRSFEFRTPMFHALTIGGEMTPPPNFVVAAATLMDNASVPPPMQFSESRLGAGRIITGAQLATELKVSTATRENVTTAIKQLEAEMIGNQLILWATFLIDQSEAEYLNNTHAREIKLGNFYPTLLEWASTVMGFEGQIPKNITPITSISSSVNEILADKSVTVVPRVGVDGMVMDINNNIYVIPVVDQAAEYEQKLMDFGLRDNGVYTWAAQATQPEEGEGFALNTPPAAGQLRLPINMPIFTDWVNDKFAYSNSAGNLSVYDLSNTVPATNFHLLKVLNMPVSTESGNDFVKVVGNAVTSAAKYNREILNETPTKEEYDEIEGIVGHLLSPEAFGVFNRAPNDFKGVLSKASEFHNKAIGNTQDLFIHGVIPTARAYQQHYENGLPTMRFVGRILKKTLEMIEGNMEAMYRHYSVMTVLQQLAVLRVLVNHSSRHAQITIDDRDDRDAYTNQGVDEAHQIQPIPLIKNDLKFQPHQAKIDNLMRKHPKSAIYGVDAGGGKTIQILTNILREIKEGVCKRALIMCPPHLVADYIKEVIYVTEGRLNIIPITNISLKSHGEDKLGQLIKGAPVNTVVITDYDFVSRRSEDVAYGNKPVTVWRNAEFLRKFEFDLVALDESHYLKNLSSGRRDAAARLIQDIQYKRLASGTFVADTIKDIVSQVALIDPTIFGSEENFKAEFASEMKGNKVIAWKEGAERLVRQRINEHVVYAVAKRKEWAALLPDSDERFYAVALTDNQRLLYDSILAETMEMINEKLARNPELRDMMEAEDDTKAEDLERLLRPYMARLERFLSAPDIDPAGEIFLKDPEDHVSPKLKKMYEIIQNHLDEGIIGKVLVFTQYLPTAEAAFMNAPPDLRAKGIWYTADEKMKARADFESDANKVWMVGQSSSMDTGLNFQHVSRLIRLETVWTPGVLEQGNSRINRPQLKTEDKRTAIYFDWIMVNKTVDVTKISRLISKVISKAKFDEYDNDAYQEIDNLPPTPITMESIAANNDFETELKPYLLAYQQYDEVKKEDYRQYREQTGDRLQAVAVPPGGMLEGSKLISRIPYVPGMNVYGAAELGLIRYDEFVRQDIDTVDMADVAEDEKDDEVEDTVDDTTPTNPRDAINKANRELRAKERVLAKNRAVHTEYGDGEITGIGIKYIRVRLNSGERVRVHKMRAFIISRATTNNVDMRNELLKQVGGIPIDTPITVPVEEGPVIKGKRKARGEDMVEQDTVPSISVDYTIINDMLFLKYSAEDKGDAALPVLQNLGFRVSPPYKFARITNHAILLRLFREWRDKGFKVDAVTSSIFKNAYETFKTKGVAGLGTFGLATKMNFQNFYRAEIKPSADPTMLKVYPQLQEGRMYVMLPTHGQTGNLRAARVSVSQVKWRDGGGNNEVLCFIRTKEEGKEILKKIIGAGIEINNKDDLKDQYTKIRMGKKKA